MAVAVGVSSTDGRGAAKPGGHFWRVGIRQVVGGKLGESSKLLQIAREPRSQCGAVLRQLTVLGALKLQRMNWQCLSRC